MTLALSLGLSMSSRAARADDADAAGAVGSDPGERGAVAGIGTLLLTSMTGGLLMARARTTFARDAGTDVAGFGFAAAPLTAPLVNGEYARAAAFSATPAAMAGANVALLQVEPNVIDEQGTPRTRVPFAIFFTVGLTSGVVGVVDSFFATSRRELRHHHPREAVGVASVVSDLRVWPAVGREGSALVVGGRW